MPLPSDGKIVALGEQLLQQFDILFGLAASRVQARACQRPSADRNLQGVFECEHADTRASCHTRIDAGDSQVF